MTTVNGFGAMTKSLVREVDQLGRRIGQVQVVGPKEVAEEVASAVARHLGGRSILLSRVGKPTSKKGRGAHVSVHVQKASYLYAKKKVSGNAGTYDYAVSMLGPAHLIERDVKKHTIIGYRVGRLGKGKGSRSKEAKYAAKQELYNALFGGEGGGRMTIGTGTDNWKTGPFQHPGTMGKHPFEKGVREVEPRAIRIYEERVLTELRKVSL